MHRSAPAVEIRQYQESTGQGRTPPEPIATEALPRKADFFVYLPRQLLDRCQLGLDFDDENGPRTSVRGKNVHRTPLAVDRVRRFNDDLPLARLEQIRSSSNHNGVA